MRSGLTARSQTRSQGPKGGLQVSGISKLISGGVMKQTDKTRYAAHLDACAAGVFYVDPKSCRARRHPFLPPKPTLRFQWKIPNCGAGKLDASRRTEYQSSGRDLFSESLPPSASSKKARGGSRCDYPANPEPPPPALPAI